MNLTDSLPLSSQDWQWGEVETFQISLYPCLERRSVTKIIPLYHTQSPQAFFLPNQGVTQQQVLPTEQNVHSLTHARFPFHRFQWWLWALCVKMTSWQKDLHFCLIHKRLQTTDKPQVLQSLQLSGARAKLLSMENWKQLWYNKVNQTKTFLLMQPLSTKFNCST